MLWRCFLQSLRETAAALRMPWQQRKGKCSQGPSKQLPSIEEFLNSAKGLFKALHTRIRSHELFPYLKLIIYLIPGKPGAGGDLINKNGKNNELQVREKFMRTNSGVK